MMRKMLLIFLFAGCASGSGTGQSRTEDPLQTDSSGEEEMDWDENLGGVKEMLDEEGEEGSDVIKEGVNGSPPPPPTPPPPPPPPRPQTPPAENGPAGAAGGVPAMVAPPAADNAAGGDNAPGNNVQAGEAGGGDERGNADAAAAANAVQRDDERLVTKLREILDDKILGYDAVLEARRRTMEVPHLLGGAAAATSDLGTMMSTGDGRLLNVIMDVSIGQNKVVTSTVDSNWRCLCRAEHSGVSLAGRSGGESEGGGGACGPVLPGGVALYGQEEVRGSDPD
jgi:hypothetical protein